MHRRNSTRFPRKLIISAAVFIVAGTTPAWATNTIKSRFLTAYPSAVNSRLSKINDVNHCGICHFAFSSSGAGSSNLNPYGLALQNNGFGSAAAILASGSQDSDGDGFTNDEEIKGIGFCNVPTFPGLTLLNVSQATSFPSGITAANLTGFLVPVAAFQVGFADFVMFASHWLQTGCVSPNYCGGADFDKNGSVTIDDLEYFSSYWLNECVPNWPWQ